MFWGRTKLILLSLGAVSLFTSIFYFSLPAQAKSSHVVINEIYPNQLSDGVDREWAELYNPTGIDLDLASYSLVKVTTSGTEYQKPLSASICQQTGEYYVCDLGTSWLANSGATLVLRAGAVEIDKVTFGSGAKDAPVPSQGQSISRIPNGSDSDNNAIDFQVADISRGSENVVSPPLIYSDKIYINEVLPQPATNSRDEFIEVYNSGDADVDLKDWQLDAGIFSVTTIVKSKQFRTFKNPEIKIGLTDTGDTTSLIDPNGDIKSTVSYLRSNRGQSYAKFLEGWEWTIHQTPNAENILEQEVTAPDDDAIVYSDIAAARKLDESTVVRVVGIVTVVPGLLSTQYFYLQDNSGGIQIYSYEGLFPDLRSGQQLAVIGVISSYNGEIRLKIACPEDIAIIAESASPDPLNLPIEQLVDEDVGMLISTQGVLTKNSGNTFTIVSGRELEVIIRATTGIIKPKLKKGRQLAVAGILSVYRGTYRILPFAQSGVTILTSGLLPATGADQLTQAICNILPTTQSKPGRSSQSSLPDCPVAICFASRETLVAAKPPRQNT